MPEDEEKNRTPINFSTGKSGCPFFVLFQPTAEHLILVWIGEKIQLWEIR